ncbi:unnamed protein product, partial [Adineta steineri]
EIKARNASDHVARLEEKENEMKTEYKRLHERYCELFKAHCDYMERTKILYGTDRLDQLSTTNNPSRSRGNLQLPLTSRQQSQSSDTKQSISNELLTDEITPTRSDISYPSYKQPSIGANFRSELEAADGKHTQTESMTSNDVAVNTDFDDSYIENYKRDVPASDDDEDIVDDTKNSEAFYKETRNDNIDISDVDASADLFGMTKEVSNLIKENNELLETKNALNVLKDDLLVKIEELSKNALNVLKDDLLVKIEELSNEQEILREEVNSLQTVKGRLQSRITEVEDELRKTREELEKKKKEEEEDVPTADRKRFTRVEMQRVLLERNQYKQRLFELEEAIHWHDALRASKQEQMHPSSTMNTIHESSFDHTQNKKRTTFWKLKGTQTKIHYRQSVQQNPLPTSSVKSTKDTSKSMWRVFSNDWLPANILKSHAGAAIQNDLREGTTQVTEFFSGLFGTGVKDVPPKRIATTNLSSSTMIKHSPTNDQIAPINNKQETVTDETLPLDRSISESAVIIDTPRQSSSSSTARRSNSILINDDNRLQAYGWSLSSKNQLKLSEVNGKVQVNVPVPVYCRPIFNTNDTTQIWCAIGIDLSGSPITIDETLTTNETSVDQLNKQLMESYYQMVDEQCLKLSSIVWIAAKSNETAMITIIDSNKAEKIIDTFTLGNAIVYAMGSVPGPSSTDYPPFDMSKWTLFEADSASASDVKVTPCTIASLNTGGNRPTTTDTHSVESKTSEQNVTYQQQKKSKEDKIRSPRSRSFLFWSDLTGRTDRKALSCSYKISGNENISNSSTKYPTVWLGTGDGWLYIHSAISEHRKTIEKVWLRHAIYSIVHVHGRVFISLANEKIVVFCRNTDGTWNLNNFHLITTGKSRESVRCMINVGESIWCGVANRVYVIDAQTLEVRKQFDVHSRPDHSVQHMTWSGDGVWLSIRLSSTLQLYHAQSYQHLQDVDVQPYVEKMIATEKAGLYFVHISALTIACRRLWIGTGNGIIISVPLTDNVTTATSATTSPTSTKPGSVVRVYDQPSSSASSSSSYIPYCSMNNAQLSFHGYRDAVKFFVAVPGQPPSKLLSDDESTPEPIPTISASNTTDSSALAFGDILVVSGGDGYIDFRIGDSITDKLFHGYRDAVKFFVAVPGQPPSKLLSDDESTPEPIPTISASNTTDSSALAFGDILVVSGGDGYIDFRIGDSITDKLDDLSLNNRNISYLIVWHLGSI